MRIIYVILGTILLGVVVLAGINALDTKNNEENYSDENLIIQTENVSQSNNINSDNCVSDDCLKVENLEYPVTELPDEVVSSLNKAIDDEYKARATYEAVIAKLGSIRPFSMIIRSEEQHISSLKALYDKYGLPIPDDPYTSVAVADTKAENCSVGVQAEIDNAALYGNNLLPSVSGYPDITSVFTSLMNASQDNHLPAFEKCAL